ncbi:RNA recognition motif domain-containing protein [Sarocladium implicatum]|nr:RNA recognition motif domain-containing protein [Sarocladium implicatum]
MASSRVFVKGLPPSITEAEFRKHFSAKGREVTDVKLIPQRRIGYVGYKTPDDASKAIKYFNRTYIRMSKIAVESAKPIADPALTKTHGLARNHPSGDHPNTHVAATATEPLDTAPGDSKKRKRGVPEPADPKLQEYLQVIGSKKESALAEQGGDALTGTATVVPAPITAPEDESDDEYEQIPSKREKQRKLHHVNGPTVDSGRTTSSSDEPQMRLDPRDTTTEATQGAETSVSSGNAEVTVETDDDWLRNRTNRLLDLADPDDLDLLVPQDNNGSSSRDGDTSEAAPPVPDTAMQNVPAQTTETQGRDTEADIDMIRRTSRLFVRNLPYTATEDDLRELFGVQGTLSEVHLPIGSGNTPKGYALVLYDDPSDAVTAFQTLDGATFQGRIIHIIPASAKKELDEFELAKLPLKKQNLIRKKAEASSNSFNWNSLYMNQDAVNESTAKRLGVTKSDLLDPTSSDAAVKQAIAETSVIQETKAYFIANAAFGKLAYRRIKDSVLFLEKAPKNIFSSEAPVHATQPSDRPKAVTQKLNVGDLLSRGDRADEEVETTSLFIRNLNFATTTSRLAEVFGTLDGFVSARVKTKMDPKKSGQTLSMGFGFAEFRTKEQAQTALQTMDGYELDNHTLAVKASHKGLDAAEERRREDKAKKAAGQRTKIIIKNLPFQATKKDVRALFGTYGQLRSVRVPKKADYSTRGFAFADFVTSREAENALNALKDTHLLGRRLVLDFAEADAVDAEEEIEKMQRKVGRQVNKVALQKLTGGGRKKVNIGDNDEEADEG